MKKLMISAAVLLLAAPAWAADEESRIGLDFGTSYRLAIYNQILDPDAGQSAEPVEGMDGEAAQKGLQRYREGFEKPAKEPVYMLGIKR